MFRNIFGNRQRDEQDAPVEPNAGLGNAMMGAFEEGLLNEEPDEEQAQQRPQRPPQEPQQPQEQAPAPQQQFPPQQQQQQAQSVFIPEDYETPAALRGRMDEAKQRKQQLFAKLRTAQSSDPNENRYARQTGTDENGQPAYGMDQVAFSNDQMQMSVIDDEIREIDWKLRDARDQASSIVYQVQQVAENFLNQKMQSPRLRVAKKHQQKVVAAYARNVRTLISEGYLTNPQNLNPGSLQGTLESVFNASVGEVMSNIDPDEQRRPVGQEEDDLLKPGQLAGQEDPDDFRKDFTDEDNRMWDAYIRNKGKTTGTLADVKAAEKKAAQKRQQQQQQGRSQ